MMFPNYLRIFLLRWSLFELMTKNLCTSLSSVVFYKEMEVRKRRIYFLATVNLRYFSMVSPEIAEDFQKTFVLDALSSVLITAK